MDDCEREYIVLTPPQSFTECVPTNITWLGGTAPYSLLVKHADSNLEVLKEFHGINATHFAWISDVPSTTLVLLEVTDARNTSVFNLDPIPVGPRPPDVSCGVPDPSPPEQMASTSTTIVTVSTSVFSPPSVRIVPKNNPVSGRTIGPIVGGIVIFIFLASFPWWRYRGTIMPRKNRNDTEKKAAGNRSSHGRPGAQRQRRDAELTGGRSMGPSDRTASPITNPFANPENVLYTEEIFAASPVSDPADDTTRTRPVFVPALRRSTLPSGNSTTLSSQLVRPQVVPRLQSVSPQSQNDLNTRMPSSGTPDEARFSNSASSESTLPPSYHTRCSSSNIYVSPPDYPPSPPPVYTLPHPPSAPPHDARFNMSRRPHRALPDSPNPDQPL